MSESEREKLLLTLKRELEFLETGGYRGSMAWRPAMIFEDSPICLRLKNSECPGSNCPLMKFVPVADHDRQAPCRYILLNEKGESVDSFYRTGTPEELETALREWLRSRINELEAAA